jgi:hypothetical protein
MKKQDKAPKTREGIKKELASAADITDAPYTETEIQEGVLEDMVQADKDETDVELEIEKFAFYEWNLEHNEDGNRKVDLTELTEMKKEELLSDVWQKRFRSIVGSPNWLAISALPEISFRVMILAIKFGKDDVMTNINPQGKCNEDVNMGNVDNEVDENKYDEENMMEKQLHLKEISFKGMILSIKFSNDDVMTDINVEK